VRRSSLSEAEDFQGACFAHGHSDRPQSPSGVDGGVLGRPKKAKVVQEISESPFVRSASKQRQSFASLDQSMAETDADEYHFWSKISSPRHEDTFIRLDADDDVESPFRWSEEDAGSQRLRAASSFLKTYDDSTRWPSAWQTSSNHTKNSYGSRPDEDHFQRPGDIQQQRNVNSFGPSSMTFGQVVNKECVSAFGLRSAVSQKKLAAETDARNSDARSLRCVDDGDSSVKSNKWWAFVHGVAPDLSTPGCLLSFCFQLFYSSVNSE